MIQFNLLPDIKQDYIKAKRQKHSVIVISMLVAASSLFIFIMMFLTVHVFQKQHMTGLDNDIQTSANELKNTTDLDKILTIQNQLNSLPGLHDQKPVVSRFFKYLGQLTPNNVSIGDIKLDTAAKTISVTGAADSLSSVNKFIDTLKFTTYNDGETTNNNPFTNVVLASFSRNDTGATYQISLVFNKVILDSSKQVSLTIPKITSTRSETEKPKDLFKALPKGNQ